MHISTVRAKCLELKTYLSYVQARVPKLTKEQRRLAQARLNGILSHIQQLDSWCEECVSTNGLAEPEPEPEPDNMYPNGGDKA